MTPIVSRLQIFPVKFLEGLQVEQAEVGIHGLKWDRHFAIVAKDGQLISGKRNPEVNRLSVSYDLSASSITLCKRDQDEKHTFSLEVGNRELDQFLSDYFRTMVSLQSDIEGGFQDIPRIGSLSIYGEASLRALQADLGRHDLDELRRRFRSNLEITSTDPYWEDQLYVRPGFGLRCMLGDVKAIGVAPRVRCPVPPRDSRTSEVDAHFVEDHIAHRNKYGKDGLLAYGKSTYYFAVDVFLAKPEAGKHIRKGDSITLGKEVKLEPLGLTR